MRWTAQLVAQGTQTRIPPVCPLISYANSSSTRPEPAPQPQPTPQPHQTPMGFVPNPARALSQQRSFQDLSHLPDIYAATLRGGGPGMFREYAIEGEDLDWTQVTDPRERKRLQNIINGRKYRERRLAAEAAATSGNPAQVGVVGSPMPGY